MKLKRLDTKVQEIVQCEPACRWMYKVGILDKETRKMVLNRVINHVTAILDRVYG